MKLLLTNDDGIDAPGLAALEEVAAEFGEVTVVAPYSPMSECGHRATTKRPLTVVSRGPGRYAVDGTPVDCVRLAMTHLAGEIDWILSGVNDGGNLGVDVIYSGTVSAVREAAFFDLPGVALSQYRRSGAAANWPWSGRMVRTALESLWSERPPKGSFWNINLPDIGESESLPEMIACELNSHPLPIRYEQDGDAYHFLGDYHGRPRDADSDVDVCFGGQIAMTLMSTWR